MLPTPPPWGSWGQTACCLQRSLTIPPPISPQPSRACFAQAQFDFSAQDPSQLSLRRGDIVEVVEREDPHWWRGRAGGRLGFFPRSYVQPVHL